MTGTAGLFQIILRYLLLQLILKLKGVKTMFTIPQMNSGATELSPLLGPLPSCSQGAVQGCS